MDRSKNPSSDDSETRAETPNSPQGSSASERKASSQRTLSSLDPSRSKGLLPPQAAGSSRFPGGPSIGMGGPRSSGHPLPMGSVLSQQAQLQQVHSQPQPLAPQALSSLLSSRFSATDVSYGGDALSNLHGVTGGSGLLPGSGASYKGLPLTSMRQPLPMMDRAPFNALLSNGSIPLPSSTVGGGGGGTTNAPAAAPHRTASSSNTNARDGNLSNPMKKPKRPMTAYNFFFRDQHRKIVKEGVSETEEASNKKSSEKDASGSSSKAQDASSKKRKRTDSSHGANGTKKPKKITFEDLGRTIGQRWKSINKEELARYTKLAKEDSKRYRREMEKFYKEETAAIFMGYTGDNSGGGMANNANARGVLGNGSNPSSAGPGMGDSTSLGGLNHSFNHGGAMGGGARGADFGNNSQDSLSHVSTEQLLQALEQQHNQQARESALMNQYQNLSSLPFRDSHAAHLGGAGGRFGGGIEAPASGGTNQYNLYLLSAFDQHQQQERAKEQELLAMLQGAAGFKNNATNNSLDQRFLAEKVGMRNNFARDPSPMQPNHLNARLGFGGGGANSMPPQQHRGAMDNMNGLPVNPSPYGDLLGSGGGPLPAYLNRGGGNLNYSNNNAALASLLRPEESGLTLGNGSDYLPEQQLRAIRLLQQQQRAPGANPGSR